MAKKAWLWSLQCVFCHAIACINLFEDSRNLHWLSRWEEVWEVLIFKPLEVIAEVISQEVFANFVHLQDSCHTLLKKLIMKWYFHEGEVWCQRPASGHFQPPSLLYSTLAIKLHAKAVSNKVNLGSSMECSLPLLQAPGLSILPSVVLSCLKKKREASLPMMYKKTRHLLLPWLTWLRTTRSMRRINSLCTVFHYLHVWLWPIFYLSKIKFWYQLEGLRFECHMTLIL